MSDSSKPKAARPVHPVPPSWRGRFMALTGLLVRRRKEASLSQVALAAQVGVGIATLQRWEEGRAEPGAMGLYQWAAALGVSLEADVTSDVMCSPAAPDKAA